MNEELRRRVRALAAPPNLLLKSDTIAAAVRRYQLDRRRLLNVGSKNVRLGADSVNFDIAAGPGVDVVGDAHDLARHFGNESFDAVVLSAVLQYCRDPAEVLRQAHRVLKPDGLLLLDAPFLQPYCPDGPDLWRFTDAGLKTLCEGQFEILELKPSIAAGPALAFFVQAVASERESKIAAVMWGWLAAAIVFPFRYLRNDSARVAGAMLLVGRKIG